VKISSKRLSIGWHRGPTPIAEIDRQRLNRFLKAVWLDDILTAVSEPSQAALILND